MLFSDSLIFNKHILPHLKELKISASLKEKAFLYKIEKELRIYIKNNKKEIKLLINENFSLKPEILLPEKKILSFVKSCIEVFLSENTNFYFKSIPTIIDTITAFDKLEISEDHPSRSGRDTFYINQNTILSTQTSIAEILNLEEIISNNNSNIFTIGRVFRRDKDSTHLPSFQQLELISNQLSRNDFLFLIQELLSFIFESLKIYLNSTSLQKLEFKIRPHFFPFTWNSFEIDVKCHCNSNCASCSLGYIEIVGGGQFRFSILTTEKKVMACGMGIERIAMSFFNLLAPNSNKIYNIHKLQ